MPPSRRAQWIGTSAAFALYALVFFALDPLLGAAVTALSVVPVLAARIFAVADVFDALRSDRPYRKAWPEAEVIAHIRAQAGQHFDPRVVDVFMAEQAGR